MTYFCSNTAARDEALDIFPRSRLWPILLKKSRRVFAHARALATLQSGSLGRRICIGLRSNAKAERFSCCRKAALSKTDFFNRISRSLLVVTAAFAG